MEYEIFYKKWLERSERLDVSVDKGDNFIALWISFNAWMKSKYKEMHNTKKDPQERPLIDMVIGLKEFEKEFNNLKKNEFFSQNLMKLAGYTVINMKEPNNDDKKEKYDGSFESLIRTIYQIRCNLFHGRKDIDDDKKDIELVYLAYDILLPLFKKYLQNNYLI